MATEKRLIYMEDAIAKIVDTPSAIAERVFNGDYGYYQNPDMLVDRQHEIIDLLTDVSTVDAVEVVHGRWVWKPIDEITYQLFCSECGGDFASEVFKYCPNCGADMRGDGDG